MKRPNKGNEMFWFPIEQINGGTQIRFNHVLYEQHLETYCNQLEQQVKKLNWVSIKDLKPEKDGNYLTYIQTGKYDNIGFTQFIDGEFMSSFVTHWAMVSKPCV